MVVQRNNLGLANAVTVDLAQVLDRFLHAIPGQADVVDRDKFFLVIDQFAVLLLVHRLDRIPVGVEDLRRVLEFVEQPVSYTHLTLPTNREV